MINISYKTKFNPVVIKTTWCSTCTDMYCIYIRTTKERICEIIWKFQKKWSFLQCKNLKVLIKLDNKMKINTFKKQSNWTHLLLTGSSTVGVNPKINNMHKGYIAAKYDLVMISDSGLMMREDTLSDMVNHMAPNVGLTHQMPFTCDRKGWPAYLEKVHIFTYTIYYTVYKGSAENIYETTSQFLNHWSVRIEICYIWNLPTCFKQTFTIILIYSYTDFESNLNSNEFRA